MLKKRVLSAVSTLVVMLSISMGSIINVSASENKSIDGSYLTKDNSSVGRIYSDSTTKGTHLMDGECSITKAGRGKIYVYASTTGNHDVDYISTVIYVDRYNQQTGKWGQIDYWQVQDVNTYYVSTSKTLTVDRGYFYRVHADHVAGMDSDPAYEEATSLTDGIWID